MTGHHNLKTLPFPWGVFPMSVSLDGNADFPAGARMATFENGGRVGNQGWLCSK